MKVTKESLIKEKEGLAEELVMVKGTLETLRSNQKLLRQQFAKAFGWVENCDRMFGYTEQAEPRTPSWEEIFVEIGKLLANQKTLQYIGKVEEMSILVEGLQVQMAHAGHISRGEDRPMDMMVKKDFWPRCGNENCKTCRN